MLNVMINICVFFFLHLVTKALIRDFFAKAISDKIVLAWTKPFLLPYNYKILVLYHSKDSGEVPGQKVINVNDTNANSCTFSVANSDNICQLIFKAVYNPASLDEGIVHTFTAQPLSEFFYHFRTCMEIRNEFYVFVQLIISL